MIEENTMPIYKVCSENGEILVNDRIMNIRNIFNNYVVKKPFITYDEVHLINVSSKKFIITKVEREEDNDGIVPFDINKFKGCNIINLDDLMFQINDPKEKIENVINSYDIIRDYSKGEPKIILDKYKIVDKNGKVLVNDIKKNSKVQIHSHKLKREFISFDDNYYINPNNFGEVIINDNDSDEIIPFDISNFDKYKKINLRKLAYLTKFNDEEFENEINKYDIVFDYGIDELDPEVRTLVESLNNCGLSIRTTGSCSGHGTSRLWVTIQFSDFISIKKIILLISNEFHNKFELTFNGEILCYTSWECRGIVFQLLTNAIGEEAYKLADEFAKALLKHKNEWSSKV